MFAWPESASEHLILRLGCSNVPKKKTRAKNKFYLINKKIKNKLIKLYLGKKISRLCLNMSKKDKLNQMLIFQKITSHKKMLKILFSRVILI